jgi:hypothetical protein
MNKLLYLSDDEVQSQLATKYNLLVHIGLESFQYAIIDHIHDQLKVLAEYDLGKTGSTSELIKTIEELPESSRQFKFAFNSIRISFDTSDYTFIPSDLYLSENIAEYGKFVSLTGSKEILVNTISSAGVRNVMAIEPELNTTLLRIFQKPKIYNQATPFLEGVRKTLGREDNVMCFLDVQARHFQVALFKDSKLELYNTFEYANADEFNYYLLNVIGSFTLEIEQTQVVLSGKISEIDEVYSRIEKYFSNIRFAEPEHLRQYSDKYEELLPHTYFTLFSLGLCE